MPNRPRQNILAIWIGGLFLPAIAVSFAVGALLYHPKTPLLPEWNPIQPLDPLAQTTPITHWKLRKTVADPAHCLAALKDAGITARSLPDRDVTSQCHIRNQIELRSASRAAIDALNTRCELALRLTMWEIHGLQPLAEHHLDSSISRIHHFGSYSCRKIRGSSDRMSEHATANALDISGFDLSDGSQIRLVNDWDNPGPSGKFLRAARNNACEWFGLVLSPDYNAAHHDHFHFDQGRWSGCR